MDLTEDADVKTAKHLTDHSSSIRSSCPIHSSPSGSKREFPPAPGTYCGCTVHSDTISFGNSTEEEMYFRREMTKTFVVFFVFMLSTLLNHFALAIVSDIIGRHPLPDLIHSLFDQDPHYRSLADGFSMAGSFITVFLIIFHRHRWIVARRLFYLGTILYIFRAIAILVTHQPASYLDNHRICEPPSPLESPPWQTFFRRLHNITFTFGLQMKNSDGLLYCGDMMFSGHTTAVSICVFFLNYYMPHSFWPMKIIGITSSLLAMIFLVISRAHYSVDVVIGYFLSSLMFSLYHAFCETPHIHRTANRAFRRLIFFWSLYEVEKKVPAGRLPNHLEWPLKYPMVGIPDENAFLSLCSGLYGFIAEYSNVYQSFSMIGTIRTLPPEREEWHDIYQNTD